MLLDALQECFTVTSQFGLSHARNAGELAQSARPTLAHRSQSCVVKDHVGRQVVGVGDLFSQFSQPLEQRGVFGALSGVGVGTWCSRSALHGGNEHSILPSHHLPALLVQQHHGVTVVRFLHQPLMQQRAADVAPLLDAVFSTNAVDAQTRVPAIVDALLIGTAPFTRFSHVWIAPTMIGMLRVTEAVAGADVHLGFEREPNPGTHHKSERVTDSILRKLDPSFDGVFRIRYYP